MKRLTDKSILLVISGGIAAYKSLELIRLLRKGGASVRAILTSGGQQFVTPLSVSALCEHEVYTDLWSLKDESEMGHIRLSREADLIVVAPASANTIAKLAHGNANDLASTCMLAADKPILMAPAMNHKMWDNPATQRNIEMLSAQGVRFIGPVEGDMACGEHGLGRMAEPEDILSAIENFSFNKDRLRGLKAIVTAGPTYEPLDPVRFIGNRSSGKQGYAIARALHQAGAQVTLISGPVALPAPAGVTRINAPTAEDMLEASQSALPADIFIGTAAVSDWRAAQPREHKIKKENGDNPRALALTENPDILHIICNQKQRPRLCIGFAAETENLLDNASAKRLRKGCDWILANDVSGGKAFGAPENHVYLITESGHEDWGTQPKDAIAERLIRKISEAINTDERRYDAAE